MPLSEDEIWRTQPLSYIIYFLLVGLWWVPLLTDRGSRIEPYLQRVWKGSCLVFQPSSKPHKKGSLGGEE